MISFIPSELCWCSLNKEKRMPCSNQWKTWRFRSKRSSSQLKTRRNKLRKSTRWSMTSWPTKIWPMSNSVKSYSISETRFMSTIDTTIWPRWQSNWPPITTRQGPEPVLRTYPTCSREMSMTWRLVRTWSTSNNSYWPMTCLIKTTLKSSTWSNRFNTCPDNKSMLWPMKVWMPNRTSSSGSETRRTILSLWSPSMKSVQRDSSTSN